MVRDGFTPPPLPGTAAPKRRRGWLIGGLVAGGILVLALVVYLSVKAVIDSGITRGPDAMFGEQHLKTAVALIELHSAGTARNPVCVGPRPRCLDGGGGRSSPASAAGAASPSSPPAAAGACGARSREICERREDSVGV